MRGHGPCRRRRPAASSARAPPGSAAAAGCWWRNASGRSLARPARASGRIRPAGGARRAPLPAGSGLHAGCFRSAP
ncbi:hypothetical protein G6F24_018817 [Rhizopus arrhizus]|nr:hypothetical protein G6F24_018817 [Rhizopus arrhizus]